MVDRKVVPFDEFYPVKINVSISETPCILFKFFHIDITFSYFIVPKYNFFCAIVLYLVVYHVCFQDGKLCLPVANDKLDGK
jgi:hypothetical protein